MSKEEKWVYIFPGQGSQQVGMGRYLYDNFAQARATFEEADSALGFSLSKLCFEGPGEVLRQTIKRQPEDGHFAPIEKILVDLFMENKALPLIELEEYSRLFRNITDRERISMATFLSYARERELTRKHLEEVTGYTISGV